MDKKLKDHLKGLRVKYKKLKFPNFCPKYSNDINDTKIPVVLSTPGKVKHCSITNKDQTSKNQRKVILKKFKFDPSEILFWNFYPYKFLKEKRENGEMPINNANREMWANELGKLAKLLKNLQVIVACGSDVHQGMEYRQPIPNLEVINVPSPAPQAFNRKEIRKRYKQGWKQVKENCRLLISEYWRFP